MTVTAPPVARSRSRSIFATAAKAAEKVAKDEAHHREFVVLEELSWYHYVPGINYLVDMFGSVPPTPAQLKELMNMNALVSALVLACALTLPASCEHDEIMQAIERWTGESDRGVEYFDYVKWRTSGYAAVETDEDAGYYPIEVWFARNCSDSIALLSGCLLTILVVFVALTSTSFIGPDGRIEPSMYRVWWKWVRVPTFLSFFFLLFGCYRFLLAMTGLWAIKVPDRYIEAWRDGDGTLPFDPISAVGYYEGIILWVVVGAGMILPVLCVSFGLTASKLKFVKLVKKRTNTPKGGVDADQIEATFAAADTDGDGRISRDEALTMLNEDHNMEADQAAKIVDSFFAATDADNDGTLSRAEFNGMVEMENRGGVVLGQNQ